MMDYAIPPAGEAVLLLDPANQESNPTVVPSSEFVVQSETRDTEAAEHASGRHDLVRMIEILTDLRSEGLEREGVQLPLLLVVTDAAGRESCPSELLESIGGSTLWPPPHGCLTDSAVARRVPITLHLRACQGDEPSYYAIEYNNEKKQLFDRSEFPAQVDSALKDLCFKDNEFDKQQQEPIFLRLSSDCHLDLSNVYFRWEKGGEHEGEETSYIEYQVLNQPFVKAISWNEIEEELYLAQEEIEMYQFDVKSDILIRTRFPHANEK